MKRLLCLLLAVMAGPVFAAVPSATNWFKLEIAPYRCPGATAEPGAAAAFTETHYGSQPRTLPWWGQIIYNGATNSLGLTTDWTTIAAETNTFLTNLFYAFVRARWPEVCQYHVDDWPGLHWRFTLGREAFSETCERVYQRTNIIGSRKVGGFYSAEPFAGGHCDFELGALGVYTILEYDYNQFKFPDAPTDPPKRHPFLIMPPKPPEEPITKKVAMIGMPATPMVLASAASLDSTNWVFEAAVTTDANGYAEVTNLTDHGESGFYRVTTYTNAP